MTLDEAIAPPFSEVLHELCYFEPEGTVTDAPRGIGGRNGHAVLAGSREQVAAALHLLDNGVPVYQGDD